jgi:hypothetical protein
MMGLDPFFRIEGGEGHAVVNRSVPLSESLP